MPATISVEMVRDCEFRVVVRQGTSRTEHRVTVDPAYHQQLTGGRVSAEELVRRSFEFLLTREPKESILRAFDLAVIGRYFPEYEREMKR
jgi:hypothetical protein